MSAPPPAPSGRTDPGAPREQRRFRWLALGFIGFLALVHVPLLAWFCGRGLPWSAAVAIFLGLQTIVVVRIRQLPRPQPPPVWFERWVIWGYFLLSAIALWFAPLIVVTELVAVLTSLPPWIEPAVLGLSGVLGAIATGVPYRFVVVRRVPIAIPGLPAEFEGLTIAQLTDLHSGPMVPRRFLDDWVRRANALKPDLIVLTGDLVAAGTEFVPELGAALSGLRARLGIYAVMGNHDYFGGAGPALLAMHAKNGHPVLRNRAALHGTPGAQIAIAGVDDTWQKLDDIDAALAAVPPGVPVVLLAHDPMVFPEATARNVALQISGHVHGGQLAIPFLGVRGSPLHWMGFPTVAGLYRDGASVMWLGAGLGTTGAPIRIGMPSELPLLILHRA